eukprot:TRINITY_DN8843_c0_g1_i3.p1 TRINITY_DN8843_c0_g1~~TRINITY_DN8843_c0_g1_i3.p1  ORF type:complete len:1094 (-),score=229.38 TRINITY_DN8843_c0_g1_i3:10-3291(-)
MCTAAARKRCWPGHCGLLVAVLLLSAHADDSPAWKTVNAATFTDSASDEGLNCLQRQVAGADRTSSKSRHNRVTSHPTVSTKRKTGAASRKPKRVDDLDLEDLERMPFEASAGCGPPGSSSSFARLIQKGDQLSIDLTESFAKHKTLTLLVTAMSIAGAFTDEFGFDIGRGEPLEDSENSLLELRLSPDGLSVDVYKPPLSIRTTDRQSRKAVKEGVGNGWIDSIDRLECELDEDPEQKRIVIDASLLISEGFYVAGDVANAGLYRILRAAEYSKNFDVSLEYMASEYAPMRLGFSVVMLPKVPMQPRANDDRLLYFSSDYKDIGYRQADAFQPASREVDRRVSMIWRYNLEALENKTIRVYVDPSVPVRWRQWFREGIEGWNDGFAQAGYPDAVRAVLPSDADWPKDYNIADARFSTISWDLSDDVVSMGIAKVDPRSGEIIKSDIIMSDGWVGAWLEDLDELMPEATHAIQPVDLSSSRISLMQQGGRRISSRLRAGHRVETGHLPRRSRLRLTSAVMNSTLKEEILGSGLKNVVMHETGHILGLRHNFKGSMGVSLSCLQDKACTAREGIGNSVMDYVPMNLPLGDDVESIHVFSPVIGAYDKLAITYGYINVNETAPDLSKLLAEAEAYQVCYDEDESGEDPTCMAYDMSQDPVAYFEMELERYIKVHQKLLQTSVAPGEPYSLYGEAFESMVLRTKSMASKLVKWLGGIEDRIAHRSLDGSSGTLTSRRPVSVDSQRRALALLLRLLRPRQAGLAPLEQHLPFLVEGSEDGGSVSSIDTASILSSISALVLSQTLSMKTIRRIQRQEYLLSSTKGRGQDVFTVGELLTGLVESIFGTGLEVGSTLPEEMDLQLLVVQKLKQLYLPGEKDEDKLSSEVSSNVLHYLRRVRSSVQAAEERLPSPGSEVPGWQHCAEDGDRCPCQGIVRYKVTRSRSAMGTPLTVYSSARAVSNSTDCVQTLFPDIDVPEVQNGREGTMLMQTPIPALNRHSSMPPYSLTQSQQQAQASSSDERSCECLESREVEDSELLQTHFSLIGRELSAVFCEAHSSGCASPRVPVDQKPVLLARGSSQGTRLQRLLAATVAVLLLM